MSEQIIKLSDNAVSRIKEIMSKADSTTIGVRVGVKSGGCAGMSYMMEYANDVNLKLVWDPPWTQDKMSEAAKLELNL